MSLPETWRILITGVTSIHGWPIYSRLKTLVHPSCLYGIGPPKSKFKRTENLSSCCITDTKKLRHIRDVFHPTHIIHCAGVCDLDVCEERPAWAYSMNVTGSGAIAETFGAGASILYMSTDLVFSGNNPPQGGYTEEHTPDPVSVAGKTFAEAETRIQQCRNYCIVRLGLPLGDSIYGDKGAIDWVEGRFKRNLPVTLFTDEFRSCVECDAIADMAVAVLGRQLHGVYHFGGERSWSLHDIGMYILQRGYKPELLSGIMRHQEKQGPPRIGDVSLNSRKLKRILEQEL